MKEIYKCGTVELSSQQDIHQTEYPESDCLLTNGKLVTIKAEPIRKRYTPHHHHLHRNCHPQ